MSLPAPTQRPVVAALFMFNNRFESNVERLERLYAHRFSRRHHIMPFATQAHDRVIPVQELGWYFHGHLAQAAPRFLDPQVTHYVLISDDLYLAPTIDENNVLERLGIGFDTAWLKSLATADALRFRWDWAAGGACQMQRVHGLDVFGYLPPAEEARQRFERLGLDFPKPWPRSLAEWRFLARLAGRSRLLFLDSLAMLGRPGPYPLLVGYADFLVLPAKGIERFIELCSYFAALNLFVEMAIPTALALSYDTIATELALGEGFREPQPRRRADAPLKGIELDDPPGFAASLGRSVERLQREFPGDWLYAHPVKFSQWQ